MQINWKVRFQNRTWLTGFAAAVVAFVYQLLTMLGIAPAVTQSTVLEAINALLLVLAALGVIIDPTTEGVADSAQALTYETPKEKE